MNKNTYSTIVTIFLCGMAIGPLASGKTIDDETPALVQALSKQLLKKELPKVAALDFTDIQGNPNELGRFVAEQLAVDLVGSEGIIVIDRANIDAVMAEHQLTAEGLVKPENAKKLGQFAGVDALLIGSLTAMDRVFTLTVKAISTETAVVVAAGRCKFDVTEDLMKQYTTSISRGPSTTGGGGVAKTSNGDASSIESFAIATRKFDNLEMNLKSVKPSSVQVKAAKAGWGQYDLVSVPVVTCEIEIINRDLSTTMIVAGNGQFAETRNSHEISVGSYRGELIDDDGIRWGIPKKYLRGISSVLACDVVNMSRLSADSVKQYAPTSIVDYIKRGKKCDFGTWEQPAVKAPGKYWAGDFTAVPPGKSIRVSVSFVPGVQPSQRQQVELPKSFQFGMELVIGTVSDGGEPTNAKNLRLENLTFNQIVMPD